jgi:cytochrome c-type biogenesis protein CcsB
MAELSDALLVVSLICYLAAMVGYAAEYAFGYRGPVARVAGRPPREPAFSGAPAGAAAVPAGAAGPPAGPEPPAAPPPATPAHPTRLPGRAALVALLLAAGTQLATVVTRGLAAQRLPWGNMYEFVLTATLIGAVAWLAVTFRYPATRHLGLYVALVNVILLGLTGMAFYTPVGPLQPALDSYWFLIHIAAATVASGIFLVGFVTAVMHLVRTGYDLGRRRFPYPLGARVPAAASMERLTFRLHAFGFPIWTFAVAAGAIWAEAAWGRYWAWDPKEVWAFITWIVYAGYLHARATPSVRPTTAAWLAVLGWFTMMMNLFGVNIFFDSLHGYA